MTFSSCSLNTSRCPAFQTFIPVSLTPTRLPYRSLCKRQPLAMTVNIHIGSVPERLGKTVHDASQVAIQERGRFSVAISGGSLPKLLAAGLKAYDVDVGKWDVFLADERVVALDHDDSNYREILSRIPSLPVIPIDPSLSSDECASDYKNKLVGKLGESPKFDMLLLGLGPDGHTCSLFPDHSLVRLHPITLLVFPFTKEAATLFQSTNESLILSIIAQLQEKTKLVAPITDSPKPPPTRVTLTYPVLNAARAAVFVVTGASKADVVQDIIEVRMMTSSVLGSPKHNAWQNRN